MKKRILYLSRLFNLLSIIIISVNYSCNKNNKTLNQAQLSNIDSLQISIKLPPNRSAGFNLVNERGAYYLRFVNNGNKDSTIIKKIALLFDNQVLMYSGGIIKNDKYTRYAHNYLIGKNISNLDFIYEKGDISLKNNIEGIIVDDLYNDYETLVSAIFNANEKEKPTIKKKLDSLYNSYQQKYADNKELSKLNRLHYLDKLQSLYPNDKSVDVFLEQLSKPLIACDITFFIIYKHIENNIDIFNFKEINRSNYSKEYISLLSVGMYNFLNHQDNKGDHKYKSSLQWLKSTDFYKNNKAFIDKNLTPLNNQKFKLELSDLTLLNKELTHVKFSNVIQENPSDYYLLDFWATWCKPCLEGIQTIHKMEIPKNVKVINLGTDKSNHQEAWKKKAIATGQKVSYLIDLSINENKEFLKFIELNSIPRYILIDNNMNIIDEAFNHPHDPEFLNILNNIKSFYKK